MIRAIDAGPVAAPGMAPRVRIAMRDEPFQARAVRNVATVKPARPMRYTRRWPRVADLAEQRHREREGEERPGDRPRERGLAGTEVAGDVAERDGEDRDREPGGEQPASAVQRTHQRYRSLSRTWRPMRLQQHRPRDGGDLLAAGVLDDERGLGVRSIGPVEASFPPRRADGPSVLVWL